MVLRQRGMRLTIISILDDLAAKLPPVRNNLELVRRQFSQRFKHEDIMMQQITPPGFNAAEKVSTHICYNSIAAPCSNILGKAGWVGGAGNVRVISA